MLEKHINWLLDILDSFVNMNQAAMIQINCEVHSTNYVRIDRDLLAGVGQSQAQPGKHVEYVSVVQLENLTSIGTKCHGTTILMTILEDDLSYSSAK